MRTCLHTSTLHLVDSRLHEHLCNVKHNQFTMELAKKATLFWLVMVDTPSSMITEGVCLYRLGSYLWLLQTIKNLFQPRAVTTTWSTYSIVLSHLTTELALLTSPALQLGLYVLYSVHGRHFV